MSRGGETIGAAVARVEALHAPAYKDRLAHTCALVLEATLPRRTGGSDYVQNVRLSDESLTTPEGAPSSIELIIFARDAAMLPAQAREGDVLELRCVLVQFWTPRGGDRRAQLFAKLAAPHTFGYRLYSLPSLLALPPPELPALPAPPSAAAATAAAAAAAAVAAAAAAAAGDGEDEQGVASVQPDQQHNMPKPASASVATRLAQLRAFGERCFGFGPAPGSARPAETAYLRHIRELRCPSGLGERPECVDLCVKILAVDQRDAGGEVVLWCWDGTDAVPLATECAAPTAARPAEGCLARLAPQLALTA